MHPFMLINTVFKQKLNRFKITFSINMTELFKCSLCNLRYTKPKNLCAHLRKIHGADHDTAIVIRHYTKGREAIKTCLLQNSKTHALGSSTIRFDKAYKEAERLVLNKMEREMLEQNLQQYCYMDLLESVDITQFL